MEQLSDIRHLVSDHLTSTDKLFRETIRSHVPLLNLIMRYLLRKQGKQMRPLFVLLSAGMHGEITPSAHRAAAMIELLHTATLIHDDVVDDAWRRRGMFSLNAIWKNKIAVLAGDYLLSQGLLLALENQEFDQLYIISDATREMSEGEIMQAEQARKLNMDEEIYFEIIRKKTASLIASCCAVGATSSGASSGVVKRMHTFGEKVGIAFQIKDDLFDLQRSDITGKPTGIDIKEKKLTLPLIHLMQIASPDQRRSAIRIIRYHRENKSKVAELLGMIKDSGCMNYAEERMHQYTREALEILDSFPMSTYAEGLKKLVLYNIDRKR